MDCCGHVHDSMPHAGMWSPALPSVEAMLAGGVGPAGSTAAARTAESASAALDVLRRSISIDVHTHGGKTGITSKAPPSSDLADAMRAGSLSVACLAEVPDMPVLGRSAEGALAMVRAPATGELYRYHLDRLAWMDELVAHHGVRRALCAADLETAHKTGQPAIIGDVEGLDFLDGKLERLEEAHQRGLRHLQLVHYTPNEIGDFQTGTVMRHGLTEFGAEVIRACHRLGFVCDVAHATEEMAKRAVKVATKPLLLSHTALAWSRAMGPTALAGRQISPDHARAIAETGGSIGIWHFSRASTDTSRVSRRWPTSSVSITSASALINSTHEGASRTTRAGCTSSRRCCAAVLPQRRRARSLAAITCVFFCAAVG